MDDDAYLIFHEWISSKISSSFEPRAWIVINTKKKFREKKMEEYEQVTERAICFLLNILDKNNLWNIYVSEHLNNSPFFSWINGFVALPAFDILLRLNFLRIFVKIYPIKTEFTNVTMKLFILTKNSSSRINDGQLTTCNNEGWKVDRKGEMNGIIERRSRSQSISKSNSKVPPNPMNYRRCSTICYINANAGCYRIVQQAQIEQRGPLYGSRVRTVDALFKRKRRHVYRGGSALLRVNLA